MVEPSLMHLAILITKATNPHAHSAPCKLQIVHTVMLDVERESTEKEEGAIA
jgi:hypothetical protein